MDLDILTELLDFSYWWVPTGSTAPVFNVIIPPEGGHGADIYRELGAQNVLIILELKMILKIQIL